MTMRTRPAWRWLLYFAAAGVIALALVVGLLRLLLPAVPQYQDDIRAWASAATGYDIRFERISASWPLAGPELSFYEVAIARPGDPAPLLTARELAAGVSLLRLIVDGRPSLGHVAVRGSRLAVERTADGRWLVQGRPPEELLPEPSAARRPELRVDLEDIVVAFTDPARRPASVEFEVERLSAEVGSEQLAAQAQIGLPSGLGRQLDLQVTVPLPLPTPASLPPNWDARAAGSGLDLVRLADYALGEAGPLVAAGGELAVEASVRDGVARSIGTEFDLRDVRLAGPGEATDYQRVAARLRWLRDPGGWHAELADLRVRREARDSPAAAGELRYEAASEAAAERWFARASFLRLEDLFPLARAALAGTEFAAQLPRALGGDVRDLEADFSASAEDPSRYRVRAAFERLAVTTASGEIAIEGLTGKAAADGAGGRLELDTRDASVLLAQWFRDTLQAQSVQGLLVWRTGASGLRLLSDDVVVKAPGIDIRSRLELNFPADDASPVIDLTGTASATEAPQVLRYLPLRRFPPQVVDWLQRAVVSGRVPQATVEFRGPLRKFPFEQGEGVFRVALGLEDGTLDYANGWPRVEDLDGEVVFDGVGMYSTRNRARIGELTVSDYQVRIRDLREGVLALAGRQRVDLAAILGFVRATPIAAQVGPTLDRVTGGGPVDAALRLALPLKKLADYRLEMLFDARRCRLGLQRLPVDLKELRGRVRLDNTRFSGTGLEAVMLGEPVRVSLRPAAADSGLSHVAELEGATPVARVTSTFGLPLREYFDGRLGWNATVRLPALRQANGPPLTVAIRSDLLGMASTMPAPLAKAAQAAWPTQLELAFPTGDFIDITGRTQPPFSWALRLAASKDGWRVERGALRAGPGEARLPARRGVEITGNVEELRLSDWLDLGSGGGGRELRETYREAELGIGRLIVAGQLFRDVAAVARRGTDAWAVSVRSPHAEGEVVVPFDAAARPLRAEMKRLWLLESEPGEGGGRTDPRDVPAVELRADDAALGEWRFGALDLDVEKAPDGLVARRIVSRSKSFRIEGDGAWRVERMEADRQYTRLQVTLRGDDIAGTLESLGFDPVMSGKEERVSVNLVWPGGPGADFRALASGEIGVELKGGQVLDIEPGSGRILGLLSVTALPRRLALDFRDVFTEGLAFDSIRGDFRVESGNAYTCNLGLSGPAADIGIVGRAGLGARDYDQLAVVRPQVSSMLAVGGAVLGGPVGGVTMLLISQIFRKPLSTLGESYYRVSGGWDQPAVERVQRGEVDPAAFKDCERELAAVLEAVEGSVPAEENTQPAPAEPR